MSIQNPKSTRSVQNRKGVYQAFDASGSVTADERWRLMTTLDGGIRIDIETVRIAPFSEPRDESLTFEIGNRLELRRLAIRALGGRREGRVDISASTASCCWRKDEVSRTRDLAWTNDCEIDYNSPLFNTVTLWRSRLIPGQSRPFEVVFLDGVTFEPEWVRQVYSYIGDEQHDTRFGPLRLAHYTLDFGGDGIHISHFWCDHAGVVFDFAASIGGGFRLVAVNFPG